MAAISVYNFANVLTLLRILMVPCFVLFMAYHHSLGASLNFILAAVTDYFDGLAARKLKLHTELGAFLDPLADKLLVLSAYVMLTLAGRVELWMTVAVFTRDLMVVSGFVMLAILASIKEVKASWWGKAATFLQMVVLSILLSSDWLGLQARELYLLNWCLAVSVVVTFISGLDYVLRGVARFEAKKSALRK